MLIGINYTNFNILGYNPFNNFKELEKLLKSKNKITNLAFD